MTWLAVGLGVAAALTVAARLAPGTHLGVSAAVTSDRARGDPPRSRHAPPDASRGRSDAAGSRIGSLATSAAETTTVPTATPARPAPRPGPAGAAHPSARPKLASEPAEPERSARASIEAARPTLEPLQAVFDGLLAFPEDVATSYSLTLAPGAIRLAGAFSPASARLVLTLTCLQSSRAVARAGRIDARLVATGGPCTLELELARGELVAGASLRYRVTVSGDELRATAP